MANTLGNLRKHISRLGLWGALRHAIRANLGVNRQQEEIDTLYYYLNLLSDIKNTPHTKDQNLRNLQLCNLQLMMIIDKICKKHNLVYWLDCGTALGAYRHNGFIPWDDDMDIAMPRDDYDKAMSIFQEELKDYPFDIMSTPWNPVCKFGIGYKHYQTGVWSDIFAMETYYSDEERITAQEKLKACIAEYRNYYYANEGKIGFEEIMKKKQQILFKHSSGKTAYYFYSPEFSHNYIPLFPKSLVDNVQPHVYDSAEFNVPCRLKEYLSIKYGFDFMKYPRSGVEHHGNEQGMIKNWAKINGIDMTTIYKELTEIYNKI